MGGGLDAAAVTVPELAAGFALFTLSLDSCRTLAAWALARRLVERWGLVVLRVGATCRAVTRSAARTYLRRFYSWALF